MTRRANQSMTVAGILAVLIAIFTFQLWKSGAPESPLSDDEAPADDDSGDDDSAPFGNLAPAPTE